MTPLGLIRRVERFVTLYREARCPWHAYAHLLGGQWRFGVRRMLGDRVLQCNQTATLPASAAAMDVQLIAEANERLAYDLETDRMDRRRNPRAYAEVDETDRAHAGE